MDEVKEAFSRVRKDIDFLYSEIFELKQNIHSLINSIQLIPEDLYETKKQNSTLQQTDNTLVSTDRQREISSFNDISTDNIDIKPLNPEILTSSTGNQGVPTDKQTNRQTDKQTEKGSDNREKLKKTSIDNAIEVLDSLDSLKKEIRLKFKRLTDQEMAVFSLLYQLSEESGFSDYRALSEKLNLTESSIRDYIGRLIKKGIPVDKTKVNNKSIQLSISENLKKIVTLPTILQLRDI